MRRKRALLVYTAYSTFVREDYGILSAEYSVFKYHFMASKAVLPFVYSIIKQLLFCIFMLWRYSVIYIWFADYHAILPVFFGKLFRKQTVIVVGGYDAMYIPVIDYGVFKRENSIRARSVRYAFRNVDLIIPVDESLVHSVNYYADPNEEGFIVGVTHFVRGIDEKIEVVPTGYHPDFWTYDESKVKRQSVITIAGANDEVTFRRKGLDFLMEIAKRMPDIPFYIAGLHGVMEEKAKQEATKNVHFLGYIDYVKLPALVGEHKVFAQFSLCEGLPNSLSEAMLCGCIPVGSAVNGIPKGIGSAGFVLQKKDVNEAVNMIRLALQQDEKLGERGRQHIIENFHYDLRREKILELINSSSHAKSI